MAEDELVKIFLLISSINDYKIVDSRPIMDQFHEIQRIYSNLKQHDTKMEEFFIVLIIKETTIILEGC